MMNNNFNNGTNNNGMNGGFTMRTGTIATVEAFADVVKTAFEMAYPECKIQVDKVTKNNSLILTGLSIRSRECNLSPTIYMDGYYEDYKAGRPIEHIFSAIDKVYRENRMEQDFNLNSIMDFDCVQDKICYKLVNRAKNKALLADAPYVPFMDLAVVFYILVSEDAVGTGTITVRNHLMDMWGNPDVQEMFKLAKYNTQRRFRGHVSSMMEVLGEIITSDEGNIDSEIADAFFEMDSVYEDNAMPMYVATNAKKLNGAGVFLYDGLLRTFAEKIGKNFFILPSSIHELIFVPDTGEGDEKYLIQMVREVNATQVAPEEILSDNVYRYVADDDRIEMV